MAGPVFPDVPRSLGVPPVNRNATNMGDQTVAPLAKDEILASGNDGNRWGIYDADGTAVLKPDNVASISYVAEHRIADFPIEEGGFESYDKVEMPYEVRVVLTKGGTFADRREFVSKLEDLRGGIDLYSVVTPERSYLKANIYHVQIDRTREQGSGLIVAEIGLRQIRESATTTFSSTKDAASADQHNDGSVQTKPATADTSSLPPVPTAAQGSDLNAAAKASLEKLGPLQIPLQSLPSQSLTVQLGQQIAQIAMFEKRTGLFLDLAVNGSPIAAGLKCLDRSWLLPSGAPGFIGNLAFIDTQGKADPTFNSLASRFQLVWRGI